MQKAVSYSTPSRNTILPFSFLQIFLIPLNRLFDSLLEIILRRIAEILANLRDVRPTVANIALALMLWSSFFVTSGSNKFTASISPRTACGNRYKNAGVHDCMWYKQTPPQRGKELPHHDTREDKSLRSSRY